jgi:hypothetical protein
MIDATFKLRTVSCSSRKSRCSRFCEAATRRFG